MLDLDQFKKLLTAGDAASANKLVEEALSSGISPSRIYLNVLLPAHIEHTKQTKNESGQSIAFFEMQRLCEMIKPLRKLGLNALVCGLDKDRYYYKVSSDCLFIDGWNVETLEAAVSKDIAASQQLNNFQLVALTTNSDESLESLEETIRALRALSSPPKIIVAGQIVASNAEKIAALNPDATATDLNDIVPAARELFEISSQDACLSHYLKMLGNRIVAARKLRRFSQQKLAQSASLDRAYISSVENGKQNVTIGAIVKLAAALNLSLEELLIGMQF